LANEVVLWFLSEVATSNLIRWHSAVAKKGGFVCVSAEASFGLTGVLVPVGIYCLKIANQRDRAALPIAAIPLLFAVQQFSEGLAWVGIGSNNVELTQVAALVYLFFALAFWLFWIPFSAMFLERRTKTKWILAIGAVLGFMGGAVLFVPLALNRSDLQVSVIRHSIYYDYADPPALMFAPQIVWHLFYLAIVTLPLLFLKEKKLIGYSTALIVSAVISHSFFFYAFASIWCFFAAGLSLYLCYTFHRWPLPKSLQVSIHCDAG